MKKTIIYIKAHPYIFGGVVLLLIAGGIFAAFKAGNSSTKDVLVVHPRNFASSLSVTGTVTAAQNVDLGFAESGRVTSTSVDVGDQVTAGEVLAEIENGDLRAALLQKQAALQKEQASLAQTEQGTRPEELALTEQKASDAAASLIASMNSTYSSVEDAVLNKSDQLFNYGSSGNPTINIQTQSSSEQQMINLERLNLTGKLSAWQTALAPLSLGSGMYTDTQLAAARQATKDALASTNAFLSDLSKIVGELYQVNSGMSQTTIDADRQTVNNALQEVLTAASSEQAAEAAFNSAENSLTLEEAGSTGNDIASAQADVKAAEADVESAQAELNKTIVTAPFDGIITKMDAKVGEIISPSTSDISLISNGTFQIVSYVPEVYISNLAVGNSASTTLDAYGPDVFFPAKIISIDPGETVVNGVANYKTTLQFLNPDPRIKEGMTASIIITTGTIPGALVVPQGAVFTENNIQYVEVKSDKKDIKKAVTTGNTSSLGEVVITSGLQDGDAVVLNPTDK